MTNLELELFIGCLVVVLVTGYRFNTAPPPKPLIPEGIPRWLGMILGFFHVKKGPSSPVFPPPRANTTLFKFWLYRSAYVLAGLLVYLSIFKVPGLADEVQKIMAYAPGLNTPVLKNSGPVLMAFFVAVVFPIIPPFKGADRSLRRCLFERASIPAQQLRERNRMRKAGYEARPEVLQALVTKLQADGFDRSDIVYEQNPTTRSLWTKASLLMEHIALWQGQDKYKTAFALLRERDSEKLSVDRITEAYEALKGNARECFVSMRKQPRLAETQKREEAFRRECRELLIAIYDLLSRVSLKSHFTDRDRVKCAKALGFKLQQPEGGPVPDSNDLIALALVLCGVCLLPLSTVVGPGHAVKIACIIFGAVLIPILITVQFPKFAINCRGYSPAVAYPSASGLATAVFAAAVSIIYSSFGGSEPPDAQLIDFAQGWNRYINHSYPWTALPVLYAVLTACRIRTGSYPDTTGLKGFRRYREWGCFMDAGIFLACTIAVMIIFVIPALETLWSDKAAQVSWKLLIRPSLVSFALGFLVPTWYRANAQRKRTSVSTPGHAGEETRKLVTETGTGI